MSQGPGTAETESISREWTAFAGTNEYETTLSAADAETPSDSVTGCEWQDFAGTNEYRAESDAVAPADTDRESSAGRQLPM